MQLRTKNAQKRDKPLGRRSKPTMKASARCTLLFFSRTFWFFQQQVANSNTTTPNSRKHRGRPSERFPKPAKTTTLRTAPNPTAHERAEHHRTLSFPTQPSQEKKPRTPAPPHLATVAAEPPDFPAGKQALAPPKKKKTQRKEREKNQRHATTLTPSWARRSLPRACAQTARCAD